MEKQRKNSATNFFTGQYSPMFFCTPSQTDALLSERRTLVILIRHGTTDWNAQSKLQGREEIPLNENGIEQAQKCAESLASVFNSSRIKGIYTSPLSRSYDTAKAVSDKLGVTDPVILEGLIERDYGSVTGMTFAARRELYRSAAGYPNDIESISSAAIRMKRTIALILKLPGQGIPLLFTHGGILNSFFSTITCGRAGSGGNIVANCTFEIVAAGARDTVPIAFNLGDTELYNFISSLKAI